MFVFEKPLVEGTLLKRKSQFTALVELNGEEIIAHIPTTNRIGDVENKDLPCLLSFHDDLKRKLQYSSVKEPFSFRSFSIGSQSGNSVSGWWRRQNETRM